MLNNEETELWNKVFIDANHPEIKIENFSHIFYAASYFAEIAGLPDNEYTTQSLLIALDKEDKYYFINAIEYINPNGDYNFSYNLDLNLFDNHTSLLNIIHDSWTNIRSEILKVALDKTLSINSTKIKKSKI